VLYADHPAPAECLSESTISLFAAFCNLAAIDNALAPATKKNELEVFASGAERDMRKS
jgi:hypothetical protein